MRGSKGLGRVSRGSQDPKSMLLELTARDATRQLAVARLVQVSGVMLAEPVRSRESVRWVNYGATTRDECDQECNGNIHDQRRYFQLLVSWFTRHNTF